MTVAEVEATMSYQELLGWYAYFEVRPPGWREDDRAFKIIQAQGVKAKPWEIFPSLRKIYQPTDDNTKGLKGLKGSVMFMKMLGAKGGDKLEL